MCFLLRFTNHSSLPHELFIDKLCAYGFEGYANIIISYVDHIKPYNANLTQELQSFDVITWNFERFQYSFHSLQVKWNLKSRIRNLKGELSES